MTEMSPIGSHGTLPARLRAAPIERRLPYKATQGRRVFGVAFKIVDDAGRALPHDGVAQGELYVRGNTIVAGYYNDPAATAKAIDAQGWLGTGDIASIDADGFLTIRDRAKDLVKSGGEWISSIDLENAALTTPGIAACAVIAVPHPKWDERPLLVAVAEPGAAPCLADVHRQLQGQFAAWQMPDDLVLIEALPLTATGKVSKLTLRQRFADYVLPELRGA
jgi:fatty-acyl-CoA synthase